MDKLLEWFKAETGRRLRLAAHLGITPGAVSQWVRVPTDQLDKVSEFTGIPKDELRPDIFKGYAPAERASA